MERVEIQENELLNSDERITNQWERITQFDIKIFWKSPLSPHGFKMYNF